jgi:hypothetical protein
MHTVDTDASPYELVTKSNRPGRVHRKFVREGEILPGVGFTADLVWYEGGNGTFSAPRHRHDFDQIRFIVSGRPDFGHGYTAKSGHSMFFPAGAHYGPEEIQEAEVMLIQWSPTWVTRAQHDQTYSKMLEVGEFKDGYYVTRDENGVEQRSDGRNAVWETFMGRKLEFPTPAYQHPIGMNPDGFHWREYNDGVQQKVLGRFTDDDVYIANYRWSEGGKLDLTPERTQLMWVSLGSVRVGAETYSARTVIFSDFGESVIVEGSEGAEAVVFGLPLPTPNSASA